MKHETVTPGEAVRKMLWLDIVKPALPWVAVGIAVLLIAVWLAGCATTGTNAPAFRTATAEEATQYGLGSGATRYEYPDAIVFTVTSRVEDPEVNRNRDLVSISNDRNIGSDGPARYRMTDVTKECVRDTDACTVTTRTILLVMRDKPLTDYPWEPSEVTATISSSEWGMVTMLIPTEIALRVLVLEALWLRENPPKPGGDCKKWTLTGDFNNVDHFEYELRAARLLEKDGYVSAHAVLAAKEVLHRYELAERKCLAVGEQIEASYEGARLIAKILKSVYADPNL